MKAIAPGKIILFGEHAVVYDKLGVAAAVGIYTTATIEKNKENNIILTDPWRTQKINKKQLKNEMEKIEKLIEEKKFNSIVRLINKDKGVIGRYVIGLLLKEDFIPFKINIKTNLRKGMGTSASLSSAIAKVVSDFIGIRLSKEKISEISFKGDILCHGGTPSGIDNNTIVYGGFLSFRKSEGFKKINIKDEIPIVIGDTKKKVNTADMVSRVKALQEKNAKVRNAINDIEEISKEGIKAIKQNNLIKIGELMDQNQEKLRLLNVSTPQLEKLIKASKEAGAYGAKLTGAGGGGCMIAVTDEQENVAKAIRKAGGDAIISSLGVEGVRSV